MVKVAGKGVPSQPATDNVLLGELQHGVTVYAVSIPTGRRLVTKEDDFVRHQTRFDRQARLNLRFGVVEVTPAIYPDDVSSQVRAWAPIIRALGFDLGCTFNATWFPRTGSGASHGRAFVVSVSTLAIVADMIHPKTSDTLLMETASCCWITLFARRFSVIQPTRSPSNGSS